MPQVQLANPSYFNPYTAASAGISQGVNLGAQLQDIAAARDKLAYEQSIRPLNRQLMDVQIANAQRAGKLADLRYPGEAAMAKQPIEKEEGTYMDYDESGNLVEYKTTKEIDPQTGEETQYTGIPKRTIKTADQIAEEKANNEAMRNYRVNVGEGAVKRAATAAEIAAWKQANPTVKTRQVYDKDMNVFEQAINSDGSLGEVVQVLLPNGQPAKRPQQQTSFQFLMGDQSAGAQPQAAIPVGASMPSAASGGDALDQLTQQFSVAPAAASSNAFATEADAEAAAAKGLIQKGDKIIIAGHSGTWQ